MSGSVVETIANKSASRQLVDSGQRFVIEPRMSNAFCNLIEAAKVLASDPDIDQLFVLPDEVKRLKADLRSRDQRINSLVLASEEQSANHKNASLHSLSLYETVRAKQNDELSSLLRTNASLKKDVESGRTTIDDVRRIGSELREKIGKLQNSVKAKEDALREIAKKMKDLEYGSSKTKAAKEHLETNIQKLRETLSEHTSELGRSRNETDTLAKSYKNVSGELDAIRSLHANLHDEGTSEVIVAFQQIWARASDIICSRFFRALPESVFKEVVAWDHLKRPADWQHPVPIPKSNTLSAKEMRSTVILGILARAIDYHIFQPTYFLHQDSGIRTLLTRQAQQDPPKESLFRALTLALLPDEHGSRVRERVVEARDEVLRHIRGLLTNEEEAAFVSDLEDLRYACKIWRQMQHLRHAVEPTFDISQNHDQTWTQIQYTEGTAQFVEGNAVKQETSTDGDITVIIPQLNMLGDDAWMILTEAVVLLKSQTSEARQESDQIATSPKIGRSSPVFSRWQKAGRLSTGMRAKGHESGPSS